MLKIKQNQWFDIDILGIVLIIVMMVVVLFQGINFYQLLILQLVFLLCSYYLLQRIRKNQHSGFLLNNQNKWFIECHGERFPVDLKDYWIHTGRLFIWLKGSNKSISFVVSRSIIGADVFSQLRTKIK